MKITCEDRTIELILTSSAYKIPRFQRPYSWDRTNIDDFWSDLNENPRGYFIGSMVLFEESEREHGLVDGQQRLTTITMLLAAVRDELLRLGARDEAQGLHLLIERPQVRTNKLYFVLQTDTSYPYLQGRIQVWPENRVEAEASSKEERSLEAAFAQLTTLVRGISESVSADTSVPDSRKESTVVNKLGEIRDKILDLSVVHIVVDNEDDATIIFQTLNSRGKDLSVSDLVRSHLLNSLRRTNQNYDPARDKWNGILASFNESQADINMDRFLLHSWLSRHDYTSEKKLFKALKLQVRSNNAEEFLDRLVLESRLYREIFEPSYRAPNRQEDGLRASLAALNLFRLQQPIPFVLALLRELEFKTLRLRVVAAGIQLVENYHFIATAVTNQPSSGGVSLMYAAAARDLLASTDHQGKVNVINELRGKLQRRLPVYPEFEASWLELRSSKQYTQQRNLVRYALGKLFEASMPESSIDVAGLTVEHISAQSGRAGSLSVSEIARIGNLMLVPADLNERLADKSFKAKQRILSEQTFPVESAVVNASNWSEQSIHVRGRRMAREAYEKVWRL